MRPGIALALVMLASCSPPRAEVPESLTFTDTLSVLNTREGIPYASEDGGEHWAQLGTAFRVHAAAGDQLWGVPYLPGPDGPHPQTALVMESGQREWRTVSGEGGRRFSVERFVNRVDQPPVVLSASGELWQWSEDELEASWKRLAPSTGDLWEIFDLEQAGRGFYAAGASGLWMFDGRQWASHALGTPALSVSCSSFLCLAASGKGLFEAEPGSNEWTRRSNALPHGSADGCAAYLAVLVTERSGSLVAGGRGRPCRGYVSWLGAATPRSDAAFTEACRALYQDPRGAFWAICGRTVHRLRGMRWTPVWRGSGGEQAPGN